MIEKHPHITLRSSFIWNQKYRTEISSQNRNVETRTEKNTKISFHIKK